MIHITDFNGDIVDFISKSDGAVTEAEHMINVEDKLETFDFTILTSRTGNLQTRNRILITDKDGQYREFIIYNISSDLNGYTRVQTNASALEDIKTSKPVAPDKLDKFTVKQALEYALADTGWEVSDDSEWGGTRTTSWTGWHDRISILKQLETTYDMRVSFSVEVGNNNVSKRLVTLKKVEPLFKGEEIVYGDNMIDLKRTVDFSDIATALICLGPEDGETGKREIVEIKDDDAQSQFGLPYRYIWDIYEPQTNDENMTKQRLTTLGRTALNKRKQASISYDIDGIGLSASAGDMIRVKNEDFTPELYVDAEVVEVKTDLISGQSVYKFGVIKEYTRDDVYARFYAMLDTLRERLNNVTSNADNIISERLEKQLDAFERYIHKSEKPPLNPKEGDLWLKIGTTTEKQKVQEEIDKLKDELKSLESLSQQDKQSILNRLKEKQEELLELENSKELKEKEIQEDIEKHKQLVSDFVAEVKKHRDAHVKKLKDDVTKNNQQIEELKTVIERIEQKAVSEKKEELNAELEQLISKRDKLIEEQSERDSQIENLQEEVKTLESKIDKDFTESLNNWQSKLDELLSLKEKAQEDIDSREQELKAEYEADLISLKQSKATKIKQRDEELLKLKNERAELEKEYQIKIENVKKEIEENYSDDLDKYNAELKRLENEKLNAQRKIANRERELQQEFTDERNRLIQELSFKQSERINLEETIEEKRKQNDRRANILSEVDRLKREIYDTEKSISIKQSQLSSKRDEELNLTNQIAEAKENQAKRSRLQSEINQLENTTIPNLERELRSKNSEIDSYLQSERDRINKLIKELEDKKSNTGSEELLKQGIDYQTAWTNKQGIDSNGTKYDINSSTVKVTGLPAGRYKLDRTIFIIYSSYIRGLGFSNTFPRVVNINNGTEIYFESTIGNNDAEYQIKISRVTGNGLTQSEINQINAQIENYKRQLNSLQPSYQLRTQKQEIEKRLSNTRDNLSSKKRELNSIGNTETYWLEQSLNTIQRDIEKTTSDINELQSILSRYKDDLSDKQHELENYVPTDTEEIKQLEQQLSQLKQKILDLQRELSNLKLKTVEQSYYKVLQDIELQISNLSKPTKEDNTRVESLENELQKLQSQPINSDLLEKINKEIEELQTQIDELEIGQVEQNLIDELARVNGLISDHEKDKPEKATNPDIDKLLLKIDELKLSDNTEQVNKIKENINQLRQLIKTVEEDAIKDLNLDEIQSLERLKKSNNELNDKIDELLSWQLNGFDDHSNALKLNDREKYVTENVATITVYLSNIEKLESKIGTANQDEIERVKQELQSLNRELNNHDKNNKYSSKIAAIKREISQLEEKLKTASDDIIHVIPILYVYRNGQWVRASVDNVEEIGGMTRESTLYETLKLRYQRNEIAYTNAYNQYVNLTDDKYYEYVKQELKEQYTISINALTDKYNVMKKSFESINGLDPSMDSITHTIQLSLEFEKALQEHNNVHRDVRKNYDEYIRQLQSQFTEEKFVEAMEQIASAIGGKWDGNEIIANIPNQKELEELNKSIREYLNGELKALDGSIEKQIHTIVEQAKESFNVDVSSIEQKVKGLDSKILDISQEVTKANSNLKVLDGKINLKVGENQVKQILDNELKPVLSQVQSNASQFEVLKNQIKSKVENHEYEADKNNIVNDIKSNASELNQLSNRITRRVEGVERTLTDQENIINRQQTEITQTKNMASTKVSYEEINKTNKTLERVISELLVDTRGISYTYDHNGLLQGFSLNRNYFKLNHNLIDINNGDVIIKDGKTTVKDLSFDKLTGGTARFGGKDYNGTLEVLDKDDNPIMKLDYEQAVASMLNVGEINAEVINSGSVVSVLNIDRRYLVKSTTSFPSEPRLRDIEVLEGTTNDDDEANEPQLREVWECSSLKSVFEHLPKHINSNVTVDIWDGGTEAEKVDIGGFGGNSQSLLDIVFWDDKDYYYNFRLRSNSIPIRITTRNANSQPTIYSSSDNGSSGIEIYDCIFTIVRNLRLNGNNQVTRGLQVMHGSNVYVTNTIVENFNIGLRCVEMGRTYATDLRGANNQYGVQLHTGAILSGNGTAPNSAPTGKVNNLTSTSGGYIWGNWNFTNSGTTTPKAPSKPKQTTKKWTTSTAKVFYRNYGNTFTVSYMPDFPIQGNWGDSWGFRDGAWYFGTAMRNTLRGKTIKRVRVSIGRSAHNMQGLTGSRTFSLRLHKTANRPAMSNNTNPTFSSQVFRGSLAFGERKWFDVTSTFASALSSGDWYGFGVKTDYNNRAEYMAMMKSLTVEVTYE